MDFSAATAATSLVSTMAMRPSPVDEPKLLVLPIAGASMRKFAGGRNVTGAGTKVGAAHPRNARVWAGH
jgi:hypothetical protein